VTRAALVVIGAVALVAGAGAQNVERPASGPERFEKRVVTTGLDAPWEIEWGPDEQLWITERRGRRITRLNPATGARTVAATLDEVHQSGQQEGLLGLALHPELLRGTGNDYLFVAFTYDDAPGPELRRRFAIRRYTWDATARTLRMPLDLITGIPAHNDHNAGRLVFGPDQKLYLSIGDNGSNFGGNRCNPNRAQELPTAAEVSARNWSKYQGKILRINVDGSVPADNPTIDGVRSHVFSYGHRNQLGLAFGPGGRLYESEHGPSSDDEVNLIEGGKNYGWPNVAGFRDDKGYTYANWAASAPEPCASLTNVNADRIPASVPTQKESAWTHAAFAEPLATFYTVDAGYDFQKSGSATIAPGGLAVYQGSAIPGWNNSVLALSLLRGVVLRVPLRGDGRAAAGPALAYFKTTNRYRDVAIHPDGRRIYFVTDSDGATTNEAGAQTRTLENPGAVLEFTFAP
jgi:PQQ-dependent dehydrogenase (s-GDH family)